MKIRVGTFSPMILLCLPFFLLSCSDGGSGPPAALPKPGLTASVAVHSNNGAFVQLSTKTWIENGAPSTRIVYTEQNRDDSSVYLQAVNQNSTVELNYIDNKAYYTTATGVFEYNIISSDPTNLNGYNTVRVTYDKPAGVTSKIGGFLQINATQWMEGNDDGRFYYTETSRTGSSIFLFDNSRSVTIELDMINYRVNYSDLNSSFYIYKISDPQPQKANGWVVNEVVRDFATFLMTMPGEWVETSTDGTTHTYSEWGRSEGELYIWDTSRDLHMKIDLLSDKIYYSVGSRLYDKEYLGTVL